MRIQGLQKLTLLDYPGRTACTVFLSGCNFRCPFCHNAPLLQGDTGDAMDEDALLMFLKKRQGVLDGVAITGGEPLLQMDFVSEVFRLAHAKKVQTALDILTAHGEDAYVIGTITKNDEEKVILE